MRPDTSPDSPAPRQWDIFCRVIDNFGDIGVCWRLVRQLAERGHTCRLWVDDASALRWMAPEVQADGAGHPGIQVLPWPADENVLGNISPGQVVVEAFGCNLPDAWVARMQRPHPPAWINLEYFSAEAYVERSHGLPSPVMHGVGQGLMKHFFFPGVTSATGGLLGPAPNFTPVDMLDTVRRQHMLHACGLPQLALQPGHRVVSLFCYAHAPVQAWLTQLDLASANTPCHVLLTPGHAQALAAKWQPPEGSHLQLHMLPALPQPQFDLLLQACDLNVVRGEDSAVSALWAGRPHLWHIYHQDDNAHAPKLEAFMAHWMADWPPALKASVQQLWRAFNMLAPTDLSLANDFQHFDALWQGPAWAHWQAFSAQSSMNQSQTPDLVTRLESFVAKLSC